MNKTTVDVCRRLLLLPALLLTASLAHAAGPDVDCRASGEYRYLCGPQSAEDLVLVPGTRFIVASGFGTGAPFYLIDSQLKTWSELMPANAPGGARDTGRFPACPGAPDYRNMVTHGLNIRAGADGRVTLYVVGHGGREAIEIFDVDAGSPRPSLSWSGCVPLNEGLEANSVASFGDGSLLVTVPLRPGSTIMQAMSGKSTGAVYHWSPGDSGFELIKGTDLPYPNGIEVSADEREFFVASSGRSTVTAYAMGNPARSARTSRPMAIVPDNLHMSPDGELITAGLLLSYAECGSAEESGDFDLEDFAACPRPFIVKAVDPLSMEVRNIATGPADEKFSNVTMALPVGGELWIGTFAGDRVAYRSLD